MNKNEQTQAGPWLKRGVALGLGRHYSPRGGRATILLTDLRGYITGRTLDVGAGANADIFSSVFGEDYEALDIGESYKITRDEQRRALRHVADIDSKPLPFPNRSYETVLCMDVLEHIDDPHLLLDELFRVSSRRVIVSLPNNWPGLLWSFATGRNITHTAGYGISAVPKPLGQRHKHFFNLEEASSFLIGRTPADFEVERVEFRFEHGHDGIVASVPRLNTFFRLAGKVRPSDARERYGSAGVLVWAAAKGVYFPLRVIDIALSAALYGWGNPVRFYNLFCRQVWVIYHRREI